MIVVCLVGWEKVARAQVAEREILDGAQCVLISEYHHR
jgi:hypothetical protein